MAGACDRAFPREENHSDSQVFYLRELLVVLPVYQKHCCDNDNHEQEAYAIPEHRGGEFQYVESLFHWMYSCNGTRCHCVDRLAWPIFLAGMTAVSYLSDAVLHPGH